MGAAAQQEEGTIPFHGLDQVAEVPAKQVLPIDQEGMAIVGLKEVDKDLVGQVHFVMLRPKKAEAVEVLQ